LVTFNEFMSWWPSVFVRMVLNSNHRLAKSYTDFK